MFLEVDDTDSKQFAEKLESLVDTQGKVLAINNWNRFSRTYDDVSVAFVGLAPKQCGGAAEMNNRCVFWIEGFGKELGQEPPRGRVKVTMRVQGPAAYKAGLKMRAKTAKPERVAEYLAQFINELAQIEPVL